MMNFILKPSLEHIALVKVVVRLWNQDDIKDLISKFCFPFCGSELKDEWPKIEDRVKEKVIQLPLPVLLKDKTLSFIKPIGFKILRWLKHHGDAFSYIDLPHEFQWTPQGTIDEKKTAQMLIKDVSIDITTRYKISCIYCLENDILNLWNKVPEDSKKSLYWEESEDINEHELVFFWTYYIKGELSQMESMIKRKLDSRCSINVYAFECAAKHGNRAAVEYFLPKLTPGERDMSLIKTAGCVAYDTLDIFGNHCTKFIYEYYSDILCILLSLMNEEEQMEVFENYSCQVLLCFLDFPWQILFVETAGIMWNFLSKENYGVLLCTMLTKIHKGFKDFNYEKLFGQNLQQSPESHKDFVLNGNSIFTAGYLLAALFKVRSESNIRMIFQDPIFRAKKQIFYSHNGQKICESLIEDENWDLLTFFLLECITSKDEMVRFKKDFKKVMIRAAPKDVYERLKDRWNKFLRMLDDLIRGFHKRKCVEKDSSERKRLCWTKYEE